VIQIFPNFRINHTLIAHQFWSLLC